MKTEREEYVLEAKCWIATIRSKIKVRTRTFGEKIELNFLNVSRNQYLLWFGSTIQILFFIFFSFNNFCFSIFFIYKPNYVFN